MAPVLGGGSAGEYFPSSCWKSTLLLETAFGCFPPRGTDEARLFPSRKPLPKLARSEPEILEGEFPVLGISRLPEEPFARVPRFPPHFAGASRGACRRRGWCGGDSRVPGGSGSAAEDAESRAGWRR